MALADIAHVGDSTFFQPCIRRTGNHDGMGLVMHLREHLVQALRLERRQVRIAAAHHFIRDRRGQKTDGGADARALRDDNPVHAQFFSHTAGMQGRRAAKGDQGSLGQLLALFHRMYTGRVGHVLFHHLGDGEGRQGPVEIELLRNGFVEHRIR